MANIWSVLWGWGPLWGLWAACGWAQPQAPPDVYATQAQEFMRQWDAAHPTLYVFHTLQPLPPAHFLDKVYWIESHLNAPPPTDTLPRPLRAPWHYAPSQWVHAPAGSLPAAAWLRRRRVGPRLLAAAQQQPAGRRQRFLARHFGNAQGRYYRLSPPVFTPDFRYALIQEDVECLAEPNTCSCWTTRLYWRDPTGRWMPVNQYGSCA
jgi:hypothetical protein